MLSSVVLFNHGSMAEWAQAKLEGIQSHVKGVRVLPPVPVDLCHPSSFQSAIIRRSLLQADLLFLALDLDAPALRWKRWLWGQVRGREPGHGALVCHFTPLSPNRLALQSHKSFCRSLAAAAQIELILPAFRSRPYQVPAPLGIPTRTIASLVTPTFRFPLQ